MSIGTGKGRGSAHGDLKRRLLLAVSVSALTTAAPSLGIYGYGGRARAQVLDAGCTDQNGDSNADAGDTVTCVAPPNPIEDVITSVDDLTVVIGDGSTPTTITSNAALASPAVALTGNGNQRLEITSGGRVEGDANSGAARVSTGSGSAVVVNDGAIYSSGEYGLRVTVTPGGTDLTIASDGSIEGGTDGVYALSYGSGAVSVSVNDVTGVLGQGVVVSADANATDVTLGIAGTVTGGANGVAVGSAGTSDVTITLGSSASVTGQTGAGITATAYGNTTVQGNSGTAVGASRGISLITAGTDIVVQRLDNVTGQAGDGVYGLSQGGNITVSDIGTVLGTGGDGIDVNSGVGDISIQGVGLTGGVTGTGSYGNGSGIRAQSTSGTIDIGGTTAVGDVTGTVKGIYARSSAGGDITITSTGTVTGGEGISLYTATQTADFQVNANDVYSTVGAGIVTYNQQGTAQATGSISVTGEVSGRNQGIATYANGNTSTTITLGSSATVTGRTLMGIRSLSSYDGADITVQGASSTGAGTVTGNQLGMWLQADLAADITVQDLVSVTGHSNDGIRVSSYGGGAVTVSNVGTVLGTGGDGIDANAAAGDISIQGAGLTGGVTGTGGHGVRAATSGGDIGIGDVTAMGDITGSQDGIRAQVSAGSGVIGIDTSAGTVTGNGYGIQVESLSTGGISVTTADVQAATRRAIDVSNYYDGAVTVDTTAGAISGYFGGIYVDNYGAASTVITTAGINTVNAAAIEAHNNAASTSLTIDSTAGSLSGDTGIFAANAGTGAVSITTGDVTGTGYMGIEVLGGGTAGSITVDSSAGTVSASYIGIRVRQSSSGDVTLTVNDVSSGTYAAIDADATTGTLAVQGSSGDLVGATNGVNLTTAGGAITVENLDSISGQAGDGVRARSNGGTITVSAVGRILGLGGSGIDARSSGGDISIQGVGLTGGVAGTGGDGIVAVSGAGVIDIGGVTAIGGATGLNRGIHAQGGGNITINAAGVVEGGTHGTYALNYGSGTTTISVYNSTGAFGPGIYVSTGAASGDISVTATGTASGGNAGIYTLNNGVGSTTINVNDAAGASYAGIFAYNAFGSTDLSVTSTGSVTSTAGTGINAVSAGVGALTVSAATVTGGAYDGIYVNQSPGGTSTSVTATGPVTGNYSGVYIVHYGYGSATVSVGDATGTTYAGIYAYSSGNSTGLAITSTGTASGGVDGIVGLHNGTGDVTVQANAVMATANDAIAVTNAATGGAMTITATGTVMGDDEGIDATAYGSGGLAITATGSVTGGDRGVQAISYGSGSVTISLANVFGGTHGVEVYNAAADATTILVSGTVTGAAGEGIYTATAGGANITVASGASVSGAGAAIETDSTGGGGNAVADTVTLEAGASLSGDLLLHAGADTFNDASGAFTAALGGADTDTVNFSGAGRTINGSGGATDAIREFEIFNFNAGGFTLAGAHQGLDAANFNTGTNSLTGTLAAATVTIADGATLAAADATSITGNVTNAGTLAIGNSPGTVTVNGNFTQSATGDLPIEIDGGDFDQLIVTGDVTLGGNLGVSILGSTPTGTQTRRIIDGGGTLSGDFVSVDSGLLIRNAVTQDTANADVLLTTTVSLASAVPSLTPNQAAAGDNLIGQLAGSNVNSGLVALANAIGVTADAEALAARLYELGPEVTDLGLKFLAMAQNDFTRKMLDSATASEGASGIAAGEEADLPQGRLVWGGVSGQSVSQDGGRNYSDFDGTLFQLATGIAGVPVGGEGSPLSIGVAGGFSTASGETPNGLYDGSVLGDKTETEMFHVGASLAAADLALGGVTLDAATVVSFTTGSQDIEMNLADAVSGAAVQQTGDADFANLDWSARVTVEGAGGKAWPVQPFVEFGATKTWQDGFSLSSSAASSLQVEEFEALRGSAGVGAAIAHRLSEKTGIHAQVSGTRYFGDTQNVLDARFAAAPSGSTFATAGKDVEWRARADAGVRHAFDNGLMLGAQVFGETGDLTTVGAGVTLSMRF